MIDPLSVTGLTLSAVDALIKLGERSAEVISDIQAFDEDTQKYRILVIDETLRTRLLRSLLFSESAIYGNKTLFEHFDGDIQNQVDILLVELRGILSQACDLLERHTGSGQPSPVFSSPSNSFPAAFPPSSQNASQRPDLSNKRSITGLLKWTLRDKKRTEAVLRIFVDRNDRLHEKIKLWCLASQLGVRADHLVHLREDETSKRLGFDKDAALKLAQWGASNDKTSLELTDSSWDVFIEAAVTSNSTTAPATFVKNGKAYLQEIHPCTAIDSSTPGDQLQALDARTKNRVEALARLLHQPKERIFRILPCVGWKYVPDNKAVAFVFEVTPRPAGAPVSLLRLLQNTDHRPELGDKFRLATELARCISQLHLVKWLHESFRSENVLLFPGQGMSQQDTRLPILFTEPWVVGFLFSRPEPFFSAGQADWDPAREIYRHPDRQGQPMETFRKIHDIYALGVVLLEIGLWEPAIKLEKNMFAHAKDSWAIQAQLLKHAQRRLEPRVGRKYKEIVIKCLTGNFGVSYDDTREEMALQQAFRSQVVDTLETSANAL